MAYKSTQPVSRVTAATGRRLASRAWFGAGLSPGQNESAGKRKSSRLRKGAPWLKTLLVQCAWAAARKKDSYDKVQFNRLKARRGPKKEICAVAASMLTAIYHMLKDGVEHNDLGGGYFDRRPVEQKANRLVAQLAKLGFKAELQPLSRVPKSGLPGFGKKLCANKDSKHAFVGLPRNGCLAKAA